MGGSRSSPKSENEWEGGREGEHPPPSDPLSKPGAARCCRFRRQPPLALLPRGED